MIPDYVACQYSLYDRDKGALVSVAISVAVDIQKQKGLPSCWLDYCALVDIMWAAANDKDLGADDLEDCPDDVAEYYLRVLIMDDHAKVREVADLILREHDGLAVFGWGDSGVTVYPVAATGRPWLKGVQ